MTSYKSEIEPYVPCTCPRCTAAREMSEEIYGSYDPAADAEFGILVDEIQQGNTAELARKFSHNRVSLLGYRRDNRKLFGKAIRTGDK